MKQLLLSLIIILPIYLFSQGGPDCSTMEPICTNVGLSFTANSGVAEASTTDPGNDYDCLITQPNPTWYYFEIATNGNINMNLTAPSDIDFIIWGPFSSLSVAQAQCGDLGNPSAEIVDCSFSSTNNEFPVIPSAVAGQVYVMLITNYANVVQNVSLTQTGGTGSTDCSIVTNPPCAMTAFNVAVSGCEFTTNTYDVTGTIEFTDPPASGSLIVEDCNGNTTVVDTYPFAASPLSFSLNNLAANGLACDVTAYFTTDPTCTQTYNYTAPLCLANCPTYDLQASSPTEACGGQIYSLEVQNLGCDGYIEFDVVGNYGSSFASEITWQVTSNLTSNVVASGGPGTNGTSFNVSTGQMDPAVQGYIYTLTIDDSYGDGFNGTGGYITVQVDGLDIIVPITGDFGFGQTMMFQAPLVVSSSTMTVNTPSGIVSSVMGNCQDHEVQFTLSNTNYCTAVEVDLPWVITCDNSGSVIASGTHTVVVYPQVPDQASDLVSVTWNTTTCSWDVSPNNDCSSLDIGTIFNITPDPTGLANYCATGNEVFNVDYIGLAGSPNCCSTAGPSVPITYSSTETKPNATVMNSPFGGVNNAANIDIAPNGTGGNATAVTLTVSYTGYCENISSTTGDDMWVTIYVDGFIIYDAQQTTANFSQTFTLADMPFGYNENSVVEVYYYPNQLGSTVYSPGTACGSLPSNYWNVSALSVSLNATFEQQTPTPVSCDLPLSSPYTCCTVTPLSANAPANVTVACPSAVPAVNVSSVTGIVSDCPTTVTHISDVPTGACPSSIARTYRVTDNCGNQIDVVQTITIDLPSAPVEFGGPVASSSTVQCIASAVAPATLPVIKDACGNTLSPLAGSPVVGGTYAGCEGTRTFTYNYQDCEGNPFAWVYTYTIEISTGPTEIGGPVASASTVQCIASAVAPATLPVIKDVCGNTLSPLAGSPVVGGTYAGCEGTRTFTYNYQDCEGNPFAWVYTYTIEISTGPTEIGGPVASASTVQCIASAVAPATLPVIKDVCGNTLSPLAGSPVVGGTYAGCEGTRTYTYNYQDCEGNPFAWIYTYTIEISTGPSEIGGPVATSSTVQCIAAAVAPTTLPVIQDACGNTLSPLAGSPVVGGTYAGCEGTRTFTYNYQDCEGNPFAWVYTYTIEISTGPSEFGGPVASASTVQCIASAVAPATLPVIQDACGNTLSPLAGSPVVGGTYAGCEGTRTFTYNYQDCEGNPLAWVYTYTIEISTSPSEIGGPVATSSTVQCIAAAVVPATLPVIQDACGNTLSPLAGSPVIGGTYAGCEGTRTYTYNYQDCEGNPFTWVYTYTIDLTSSPSEFGGPVANSSTVSCASQATAPVSLPVIKDACGNTLSPLAGSPTLGGTYAGCEGTITYTYNYADCAGNPYSWIYTYTVDLPTFTIPYPNGSSTVACPANAVDPGSPGVVTDACGNTLTPVITAPSTVGCSGGTMDWIYTYTDCAGNTANWTYSYTVAMPPFTLPFANTGSTVNCVADAQVQPTPPSIVNDQCGNVIVPTITSPTAVACEGAMAWIFTYTDCAGNTLDWTYTYTVDQPAFTLPFASTDGSTVNCVAAAQVQPTPPATVTDMCSNTLTPTVTTPTAVACEGTMAWIFTYTDCAGNTLDWTYTYTIDQPAFTLPFVNTGSTVNCVADAQVQPTPPAAVIDVCGNALTPTVTSPTAVVCEGTMAWIFSYTDCAGNTLDWTYTYTIDQPAFTLPFINTGSTVNCVTDAQVQPIPPATVTDMCGNTLTPTVTSPTAVACEGTMAWIFTYTDCAGNTLDWTYTYTIDQPIFTIPYPNGSSTVACPANAADPGAPGIVTDACGNTLTPVVTAPSTVGCSGGTMDWIYTYTDCAGNTANWTFSYTVTMPPFTLLFANTGSTVDCVADAQVQPTPPSAVNDQCGNVIVPTITSPTAVTCEGTMAWIFTYTDCAGNTLDWTYTYIIDQPAFTLPFAATDGSTVNCVAAAQVQPIPPAAVTDMCGNTLTPTVTSPTAVACEGTMAWIFTYTDCAGNTLDWTYSYTIDQPAFTLPFANSGSTVNCVADAQVQPTPPAPPVTDICGNTLTPSVTSPTAVACEGTMAWIFTYTDCAGNSLDWTYTYTIDQPAFTLPFANTGSTVNCVAAAQVQPTPPATPVTDMCGNTLTPTVTSPTAVACEGTMAWIFTYSDCAGNTLDWTYTYTIDQPTFTIPYPNGSSTVACPVNAVDPGSPGVVADVCGNTLTPIVTSPSSVGCSGGTMDWIYTYTDCAGNTANWTYSYTVSMPPFTLPFANTGVTVGCVADAQVQPTPPSIVNDQCGNVIVPTITSPTAVACEGTMAWIFTYTDCAGNTLDWTYTYTVDQPAFTLPFAATDGSTVNCVAAAQVQPTPPATVTDMCGNTLTPTVTAPTAVACEGTMAWIFTYTDCAGNTLDWTYTYTIDQPAFTLPFVNTGSTVNCVVDAQVQPIPPATVTDMCGNTLTPTVTTPTSVVCEGTMAWIFTYTDCAGNTLDWTYTYTIDQPAFALPFANTGSTVNCVVDAQVQPIPPATVTDMCGNTLTPTVTSPTAVACEGTMAWIFTYTDCAGNTLDWTYTYTIDQPTFTVPYANDGMSVACPADAVDPGSPGVVTDACGNTLTPVVTPPSLVGCNGSMDWLYTYTDCAGNSSVWTYSYTITMPAFSLPFTNSGSTVNCSADALVQPVPPAAVLDACGNTLTPTVTSPTAVACEGTMAWLFTYEDCAGNTLDWTYTYTVDIPALILPADDVQNLECVSDIIVPVPPSVTDACGNSILPVMTENADPACSGSKIYTFTYTNCAGASSAYTFTYVIDDNIAPTASSPDSIVVEVGQTVPGSDISVITDAVDNCSPNPVIAFVGDVSDNGKCPEKITRTYSITDDCGNTSFVTQIIIVNSGCEIVVPTAFTPNDDQSNDVWEIVDIDNVYPDNIVFVYNRWGNLLYESNKGDYSSRPWDGKVNGEPLPVASYYYIIFTEGDKSGEVLNGTVSIIKN